MSQNREDHPAYSHIDCNRPAPHPPARDFDYRTEHAAGRDVQLTRRVAAQLMAGYSSQQVPGTSRLRVRTAPTRTLVTLYEIGIPINGP